MSHLMEKLKSGSIRIKIEAHKLLPSISINVTDGNENITMNKRHVNDKNTMIINKECLDYIYPVEGSQNVSIPKSCIINVFMVHFRYLMVFYGTFTLKLEWMLTTIILVHLRYYNTDSSKFNHYSIIPTDGTLNEHQQTKSNNKCRETINQIK